MLLQMEFPKYSGDRAFFKAIRQEYLKLEAEIHQVWHLALLRKFRLLKLKHVGFVQFIVMPSRGTNRPEMIEPGRSPEEEVDHN
ncbi:hypothetical protein PG995_004883 [Apiospora arundinis]